MAPPQNFLKMQNIFGPEPQQDERFMDMPSRLPSSTGPYQTGSYQTPVRGTLDQWMPPDQRADMMYQGGEDTELMDAFKRSVLNPPERTQMTYPKSTLNTLEAALKIAATPTEYEKNRVFVDGNAYQKQRVMYDPVTGEQKFITNVEKPGFMKPVVQAMAAGGMQGPIDVLNQPYQDEVADFKLRHEALKDAVTAEGLNRQRLAQAGYTGQRAGLEQQKIDINRMTAEERARVMQLNTLTDAQKIAELQAGRISLAELQAAEAMKRVQAQQTGATERTRMQQTGAGERTAATQAGANARAQAAIASAERRVQMQQAGANERNAASIRARAATGGQSETQNRVEIQRRAAELLATNPELSDSITWDENGFPVIDSDDPVVTEQLYGNIYGASTGSTGKNINLPAPPTAVTPSGQTAPIGTPQMQMAPGATAAPTPPQQIIKQYSRSTDTTRISTDGGKTWKYVKGRQ